MRCRAKGTIAPVNERRAHACGFRTDAVEGMVGYEKHLIHPHTEDPGRLGVGGHMRLERLRRGHRNDLIERHFVPGLGRLEHVGIPIGEHDQLVAAS